MLYYNFSRFKTFKIHELLIPVKFIFYLNSKKNSYIFSVSLLVKNNILTLEY